MWKTIIKFPNYEVSTSGEIKNKTTFRILKSTLRNGYKSVSLSHNNIRKTVNIHKLVAEAFLQIPDEGKYVVNHKDENKLNNYLDNLEYITYAENTKYSSTSFRSKNKESFNIDEFFDIPNHDLYKISKSGKIYSKIIDRLMCFQKIPQGYLKVKLKDNTNNYKDWYIHTLMGIVFLNYNYDLNKVINHIDGNKSNNTLENLEIISKSENALHSIYILNNKIFKRKVYYIDNEGNEQIFESAKSASEITGIDNSSILKCCKNKIKLAGNLKWKFYQ
jgi:hypothetical protein